MARTQSPLFKTEPVDDGNGKDDFDDPVYDDDDDESSDDEEEGGEGQKGAFKPLEQLEQYNWHRRNINELVDMMSTPFLILDPSYQRNVVWSRDRMIKLINSLLANYYVPPLIFNVKKIRTATGGQRFQRVCIDGKQRLSSIKEFVNGNIPCIDHRRKRWWYVDKGTGGKKRRNILPEAQKNHFRSLDMLCVEYSELKIEEEEELFSRVQMGMVLTVAEKLRARTGPWQDFAKEMERLYPDLLSKIDNKRGSSFQAIVSTFRIIIQEDEDNPKYTASTALQGFLDKPQLLDEAFKARARRVFHIINNIFIKYPSTFENNNYKHAKKFAPIEFVGVALLVHRYHKRHIGLLAGDIKDMRDYLRTERQELRANSTTFLAISQYINDLEKHRGGQGIAEIPDDEERVEAKPKITSGKAASTVRRLPLPPPKEVGTTSTPAAKRKATARAKRASISESPAGPLSPHQNQNQNSSASTPQPQGSLFFSSVPTSATSDTTFPFHNSPPVPSPAAYPSSTMPPPPPNINQPIPHKMPPAMAPIVPMSHFNGPQDPTIRLRPDMNRPSPANSRKRQRREEEDSSPSVAANTHSTDPEDGEVVMMGYRDNVNGHGTSSNFTSVNIRGGPSATSTGQSGTGRGTNTSTNNTYLPTAPTRGGARGGRGSSTSTSTSSSGHPIRGGYSSARIKQERDPYPSNTSSHNTSSHTYPYPYPPPGSGFASSSEYSRAQAPPSGPAVPVGPASSEPVGYRYPASRGRGGYAGGGGRDYDRDRERERERDRGGRGPGRDMRDVRGGGGGGGARGGNGGRGKLYGPFMMDD